MSLNWQVQPRSMPYHIVRKEQPDGTWMAWFGEAPTTYAFGKTETEAMANLVRLFQPARDERRKEGEDDE